MKQDEFRAWVDRVNKRLNRFTREELIKKVTDKGMIEIERRYPGYFNKSVLKEIISSQKEYQDLKGE